MHAKLEAQDIRLEYFQPRTNSRLLALDGVDLKIMDGEFVSIVGPSGCGKTTFLSVVDGLIAASAGRILVDGRMVTKPGPDRAVVFQDASLLPWRTVLNNVRYGLECLNVGARAGHGSEDLADGRTVRIARRANPRSDAGGAAANLGEGEKNRAVRDPSNRRSDLSIGPCRGLFRPAGKGQGDDRGSHRATAPAGGETRGAFPRNRRSHLEPDRGGRE